MKSAGVAHSSPKLLSGECSWASGAGQGWGAGGGGDVEVRGRAAVVPPGPVQQSIRPSWPASSVSWRRAASCSDSPSSTWSPAEVGGFTDFRALSRGDLCILDDSLD